MNKPTRIVIEPHQVGWQMTIEAKDGSVLDHTLSSSRWMVWGMARLSWRHLTREYWRHLTQGYRSGT